MPSALGKRQRSDENEGLISTRSKRCSVARPIDIHDDENQDPRAASIASVGLVTPKRSSTATTTGTKSSIRRSTARASPLPTIDSHFSISKPSPSPSLPRKDSKTVDLEVASKLQTPRHRDGAKVIISPNRRVATSGGLRTPRTPKTPREHDFTDTESVYNRARQVFLERSDLTALIGRDDERGRLSAFISKHLDAMRGGCLYVSGPPGTGKSAFVNLTLERLAEATPLTSVSSASINCMSVKTVKDLVKRLSEGLGLELDSGALNEFDTLKTYMVDGDKFMTPKVVVLDEIDRLIDLDIRTIYSLFEWATHPQSKVILIGIANALDLTDRLLPRLKSRDIKPDLLPFMPYTHIQIEKILATKLKSLTPDTSSDHVPIIHPAALALCSKKVAANTGDLRKAFDICARAVDLVAQETKTAQSKLTLTLSDVTRKQATPLKENPNLSSPSKSPRQLCLSSNLSHLTYETAPRATIAHMARITASIFSNGTTQRLTCLNMQQKAVLYVLAGLEEQRRAVAEANRFSTPSKRHGQNGIAPTVKQLYSVYSSLCKRDDSPLHPLSGVEFRDVLGGLETLSLVSAVGERAVGPVTPSRTPGRRRRTVGGASSAGAGAGSGVFSSSVGSGGLTSAADDKKWSCCVGRQELRDSLSGPGSDLLKNMLEGVDLLGA